MFAAVRDLLLEGGDRTVTIAAVSERSGAPIGTIYHRFGSRADLIAELWITTVRRLQTDVLAIDDPRDRPEERAVAMALATMDFCAANPHDARLLTLASREDLLRSGALSPANEAALSELNTAVTQRLIELSAGHRGASATHVDQRIMMAAVSIPYVAVRQLLRATGDIASMRATVERAARAVLLTHRMAAL